MRSTADFYRVQRGLMQRTSRDSVIFSLRHLGMITGPKGDRNFLQLVRNLQTHLKLSLLFCATLSSSLFLVSSPTLSRVANVTDRNRSLKGDWNLSRVTTNLCLRTSQVQTFQLEYSEIHAPLDCDLPVI